MLSLPIKLGTSVGISSGFALKDSLFAINPAQYVMPSLMEDHPYTAVKLL